MFAERPPAEQPGPLRRATSATARSTSTPGSTRSIESRFANGAFARFGVTAGRRTFDQCSLQEAGFDANSGGAAPVFVGQEIYADGSTYCHREYGYRPDIKALGSYPMPGGVQLSATYQFSRGVQTGGAGPSILGTWNMTNATPGGERFDPRTQPERGLGLQVGPAHSRRPGVRRPEPAPARSPREQAVHGRPVPLPDRLRPLQRLEQQLAVHGEHDVLSNAAGEHLAPADARARRPDVQDRRAVPLLVVRSGGRAEWPRRALFPGLCPGPRLVARGAPTPRSAPRRRAVRA